MGKDIGVLEEIFDMMVTRYIKEEAAHLSGFFSIQIITTGRYYFPAGFSALVLGVSNWKN